MLLVSRSVVPALLAKEEEAQLLSGKKAPQELPKRDVLVDEASVAKVEVTNPLTPSPRPPPTKKED